MKYSTYNVKTISTFYPMVSKYLCELLEGGFFNVKILFINRVPFERLEGSVLTDINEKKDPLKRICKEV